MFWFSGKDYREQINELTSFIDLGNVYGNSYLVSKAMEAGVYGEIATTLLPITYKLTKLYIPYFGIDMDLH